MGKQIAVAMARTDEALFLEFLRSIADIRIFKTSAPSKEALVVYDFSKDCEKDNKYYIWNMEFPWDMETGRMTGDESGKQRNWYYIKDSEAPLIEYVRHNFYDERLYGRIYWSKYFAAT